MIPKKIEKRYNKFEVRRLSERCTRESWHTRKLQAIYSPNRIPPRGHIGWCYLSMEVYLWRRRRAWSYRRWWARTERRAWRIAPCSSASAAISARPWWTRRRVSAWSCPPVAGITAGNLGPFWLFRDPCGECSNIGSVYKFAHVSLLFFWNFLL